MIGARGSKLSLAQTRIAADKLKPYKIFWNRFTIPGMRKKR